MQFRVLFVVTLCLFCLTQCTSYDFSQRIVQQGNLLPQEKVDHLKIGMSKEKVAIIMGTSLLSPLFNDNRWDYAYTWRKGSGPLNVRHVTLHFSHGKLTAIEHHP